MAALMNPAAVTATPLSNLGMGILLSSSPPDALLNTTIPPPINAAEAELLLSYCNGAAAALAEDSFEHYFNFYDTPINNLLFPEDDYTPPFDDPLLHNSLPLPDQTLVTSPLLEDAIDLNYSSPQSKRRKRPYQDEDNLFFSTLQCYNNHNHDNNNNGFFLEEELFTPPPPPVSELLLPPLPDEYYTIPKLGHGYYGSGFSEEAVVGGERKVISCGNGNGGGTAVSAQSVAARERRRKITEKTHELGKLVPGGSGMNTAEMLGAAFKYVKFLQAQLGILQFTSSLHQEVKEEAEESDMEELGAMLESPTVQEKLYMEQKCLVLKHSVHLMSKHRDHLPNPSISDNLKQLLSADG